MNGNEFVAEANVDRDKLVKILGIIASMVGGVLKLVPGFTYANKLGLAVNYLATEPWVADAILNVLKLFDGGATPSKEAVLAHFSK